MTEQTLYLHDLSFVSEGGEVVVGRLDTGSYAVFPADGAELLRRLGEGMPLSHASAWYEGTFGEPVDIDDFAVTLAELGFVREPGAEPKPVVGRYGCNGLFAGRVASWPAGDGRAAVSTVRLTPAAPALSRASLATVPLHTQVDESSQDAGLDVNPVYFTGSAA